MPPDALFALQIMNSTVSWQKHYIALPYRNTRAARHRYVFFGGVLVPITEPCGRAQAAIQDTLDGMWMCGLFLGAVIASVNSW